MLRVALCHCYRAIALLMCLALGVSDAYAIPGVDQSLTVTALNTQINRYAPVTAISGSTVTVTDITLLNRGAVGHFANNALSPGDLVLIYQAQGATFIDSTNAATYGAFDVQNAGLFEYAEVLSTTGNTIVLCSSPANTYSTATGHVQVVRVPQYTDLTVNSGASVVAADWNGASGGIVAVNVAGTLTVNGEVNVDSRGFRGGDRNTAGAFPGSTSYRTTDATLGAEKGESILGFRAEYDLNNGRYGRGAPANGGGGGDAHNASGGGGANGNNTGTWTGAGVPDLTTLSWRCAWDLDDGVDNGLPNNLSCTDPNNMGEIPSYFSGGAGGGRGGYSYGANDSNANTTAPGNTAWGGDNRRQVGGLGGRPLANDPASRLFFGGGGGGGDNNPGSNTGTNGARGGGLILVDANSLTGSGALSANGGTVTTNAANDGSGGGGGGGTIVVRTVSAPGTSIVLRAAGGRGGNQVLVGRESEGPGGGGGGGYIRVSIGATFTTPPSVAGGANGTSNSNAVTEFLPNGATRGYPGAYQAASFTFPGAQRCGLDFGDAPDPSYPTLLANNGPRHLFPAAALRVSIGSLVDGESNGLPNATATGDDINNVDDEDGVAISAPLGGTIQTSVTVQNNTGASATLCAWLDGAGTGVVNDTFDAGEGQCVTVGTGSTVTDLTWTVPNTLQITTYLRVRVTTGPLTTANPTGLAINGEVEDHQLIILPTRALISRFAVERDAATGLPAVVWDTASEQGTLGFYLERWDAGLEQWLRLNADLLPGLIDAPMGGQYRLIDDGVAEGEAHRYRLIEVEAWGGTNTYGPYEVSVGGAGLRSRARVSLGGRAAPAAEAVPDAQSQGEGTWADWRSLAPGFEGRARQPSAQPRGGHRKHGSPSEVHP